MEPVARLGVALPPGPGRQSRPHGPRAPLGHRQRRDLRCANGPAEGINSRIKTIKARSRGFRNQERFANAIYFHLGGLDLYPDGPRRPVAHLKWGRTTFLYTMTTKVYSKPINREPPPQTPGAINPCAFGRNSDIILAKCR